MPAAIRAKLATRAMLARFRVLSDGSTEARVSSEAVMALGEGSGDVSTLGRPVGPRSPLGVPRGDAAVGLKIGPTSVELATGAVGATGSDTAGDVGFALLEVA